MSFDTDPNDEITISASDLAQLKGERDALVQALTIARDQDDYCIRNGMSAMPANKRQTIDDALAAAGAPQ